MINISELMHRQAKLVGLEELTVSAVCIPLIRTDTGYDMLFEVRAMDIKHQPGDVCFPGGMAEPGESGFEAARRELGEELCVDPSSIEIVGAMDYVVTGRVVIYPYLVILNGYQGSYSPAEVDHVFTVPLDYLLAQEPSVYTIESQMVLPEDFPYEKIYGGRSYQWRRRKEQVYFYEYEDHVIWGLTAKILKNTLSLLKSNL